MFCQFHHFKDQTVQLHIYRESTPLLLVVESFWRLILALFTFHKSFFIIRLTSVCRPSTDRRPDFSPQDKRPKLKGQKRQEERKKEHLNQWMNTFTGEEKETKRREEVRKQTKERRWGREQRSLSTKRSSRCGWCFCGVVAPPAGQQRCCRTRAEYNVAPHFCLTDSCCVVLLRCRMLLRV